jgi:hypothetical protein
MHRLPNGRGSERRATSRDREGVGAYSRRRSCRLLLGDHALALIRDISIGKIFFRTRRTSEGAWLRGVRSPMCPQRTIPQWLCPKRLLLRELRPSLTSSDATPHWTIYASRPLPVPAVEHAFGTRGASAMAVRLNDGSRPGSVLDRIHAATPAWPANKAIRVARTASTGLQRVRPGYPGLLARVQILLGQLGFQSPHQAGRSVKVNTAAVRVSMARLMIASIAWFCHRARRDDQRRAPRRRARCAKFRVKLVKFPLTTRC